MKRKYLFTVGSIVMVIGLMIIALVQVRSVRSGPQASTPTPTYDPYPSGINVLPAMPTAAQPKITDLAPNIPNEDKPAVVVQHADGSREMFLVAPDAVDAFVENLPPGDELKVVIPPPSLMRTPEAPQSLTPTPPLEGYETIMFNQSKGTVLPIVTFVVLRKYSDLSPELPVDMKVAVTIRHADGTLERYDMARTLLDTFIRNLPEIDIVMDISSILPASGGFALPTSSEINPIP